MQEVYLAAYRNIGSLKNTDSIYSWLGGITLRQGMKLVNRKKTEYSIVRGSGKRV